MLLLFRLLAPHHAWDLIVEGKLALAAPNIIFGGLGNSSTVPPIGLNYGLLLLTQYILGTCGTCTLASA